MTSLLLGDFELVDPQGSEWGVEVLAEGTSRGTPVPINVAVKSWLQDGAIVVTQGYDNREVQVRVIFTGADLAQLADAEAALFAELGKPNTLTWTPPDGFGPPSVFDVITSQMDPVDDDMGEIRDSPERTYQLSLTCKAFVRSVDEVVTEALPASGTTTTLVDNGSATTNWTGAVDGVVTAPAVVSGAVKVTSAAVPGEVAVSLTRTASIDTSVTPYLVIDWKPESAFGDPSLRAYGDGVELARMAQAVSPTSGYTRTWFDAPVASVAVLRLDSTTDGTQLNGAPGASFVRSLAVDNIDRTDVRPTSGTARQLMRSIEVVGSARTQGDLIIEHETDALGDLLAYVWPDVEGYSGYYPPLRPHRVSGGAVTADAALVSGAYETLSASTVTWDIPLASIIPSSHYFAVRVAEAAGGLLSGTLTWTVSTRVNGTTVGDTESKTFTLPSLAGWRILTLGRTVLPTRDVDPAAVAAFVRLTLTASGNMRLDEAWLFSAIGQLIGPVACGSAAAASGGPARRAFILSPTVIRPRSTVRIGHASDRSDSFYAGSSLGGWQFPQFTPPRQNIFTVTTNALGAAVSLRHTPAWHTHAAR